MRTSRICREVQAQLPALVDGTLPRWRGRLVGVHRRRCPECTAELERQRQVAASLERLGSDLQDPVDVPPEGLLGVLLEQADHPGLRGRAAVPARGAVSGARPALSAALLLAAAAAGTAAGYGTWRAVRSLLGTRRP